MKSYLDEIDEIIALDDKKPNVYLLSKVYSYIHNKKLNDNIFIAFNAWGTHGYIINNHAAQCLYKKLKSIRYEADMWWIFRLVGFINIYCHIPHIINTKDIDKSDSTIESERKQYINIREKIRINIMKNGSCSQ
ncbi:hypothetical protein [Xenorhabdus sp. KJ12.1]|uniref:hypothetical protein n=1 Tax=Xenorhabdus sp. KJ12.1 TaxID=1851571 RepID=UPI000C0522A9|nr:hypothetical protein [Xenorhabdus sp. KJ12.1]PHM68021.1 hypothetical protein Xekj_03669 [Xenorhabdus sp. KJ12.1]